MILCFQEEEFKAQEEEKINADGQEVSENLYFMKQCVGNACGTVALIHAIANNQGKYVWRARGTGSGERARERG